MVMIPKSSMTNFQMGNDSCVFIVGPTAVGKTATAIEVATRLNTEIVSADSRQIYSELSIGTAVPTSNERSRIKHHLVQHHSVEEYYNASMFEQEALNALESIFKDHQYAVVCGGSGLYIKAIIEGIDDIPAVDPDIRKDLIRRLDEEGIESLRFELKRIDPVSYESIDLKNPKRLLKAMEISLTTGKPYSSFLTTDKKSRSFNIIKAGLELEREELYHRINQRVEDMMAEGLLEEAEACLPYRNTNALNTVGYKELFNYIDGKHSLEEAVRLIKRNSRRYARRQMTWFRRDKEIRWFNPDQIEEIMLFIKNSAS